MPSTAPYPLSLRDALPISALVAGLLLGESATGSMFQLASPLGAQPISGGRFYGLSNHLFGMVLASALMAVLCLFTVVRTPRARDRKSTRLNSSHVAISYAVHRPLPSFPTRRSSDLGAGRRSAAGRIGHRLDVPARLPAGGAAHLRGPVLRLVEPPVRDGARLGVDGRAVPVHGGAHPAGPRSEEHTSELQSRGHLVCRPPPPTLFPYATLFRSRRWSPVCCWANRPPARCSSSPPRWGRSPSPGAGSTACRTTCSGWCSPRR